jgi:hypothetical protein
MVLRIARRYLQDSPNGLVRRLGFRVSSVSQECRRVWNVIRRAPRLSTHFWVKTSREESISGPRDARRKARCNVRIRTLYKEIGISA